MIRIRNITKKTLKYLFILAFIISGGYLAYAQFFADAYVVKTVHIFPAEITGDGWNNLETLTFQNLEEYALLQEFNSINSATMITSQATLNRLEAVERESASVNANDNSESQTETEVPDSASNTSTAPTNTTQPQSTTSTATNTSSVEFDVNVEVEQISSPNTNTSTPPLPETADPAPAPADEEDESESSTSATTTVMRQVTSLFRLAVETVTSLTDSSSTTTGDSESTSNESLAETDDTEITTATNTTTTDVVADEESNVTSTSNEESLAEPETEENLDSASTTEPTDVIADTADENQPSTTSTTETTSSEEDIPLGSDDVETNPTDTQGSQSDVVASTAEPVFEACEEDCRPYVITLNNFGFPLDDGVDITGAQLRMSFAASKKSTRERLPLFEVRYSVDGGITWEDSGAILIDEEESNGVNGGYYLFAISKVLNQASLNALQVELKYHDDPRILEDLFVESVWLELFTLEPPTELSQTSFADILANDGYNPEPLSGDTLLLANGETLEFKFTDNNDNETLIIKSNEQTYHGVSEAPTYFSVTNISDNADEIQIQTYFPNGVGEVTNLQVFNQNKPRQVIVPEFRPYVYHCEAGWEYAGEFTESSLEELSRQLSTPPPVEVNEDLEPPTPVFDVPTTSSTTIPLDDSGNTTTNTTTVLRQLSGVTQLLQASTIDTVSSSTEVVSTSTEIVLDEENDETAVDLIAGYTCRNTNVVRPCDELDGDNTACRVNQVKVQEHEVTNYVPGWDDVMVATESLPKPSFLKRAAAFIGFGPDKKEVPEQFEVRVHTPDTYEIQAGETLYFKMDIKFPPFSTGEYWIEAIGNREYGLLDPFWSSQWQYRLPITFDNTLGTEDLTEHQVFLELDDTLSDFWSNVNADGSDIRFVSLEPGNVDGWFGIQQPDNDWYNRDWESRLPISIQASQVDSTLIDFPVYVDLSTLGDDFFNNVQADGDDIRITQADGETELPYELVDIDTGAGSGELYFRASTISSSADTTFYVYYDNPSATGYSANATFGSENVWSNGYEAVYHLDGVNDSTSNNRNLTALGSPNQIGSAYDFNGTSDFLQMPTNFNLFDGSDSFVWQVYFNADAVAPSTAYQTSPVLMSSGGENNAFFTFGDGEPGSTIGFRYEGWTTPVVANSIAVDTDYYLTFSYNQPGADLRMYLNGAETDSFAGTFSVAGGAYQSLIGGLQPSEPDRAFDGTIYEVRILSNPVTAQWVDAEYTNLNAPTTFYATSTSESVPELEEIGQWSYRLPITIDGGEIDTALTDFPVYVDLADLGSAFFTNVQASGADIRITTADGLTELAYDLVSIDTGGETGQLHFLAPSISDTVDTTFYVYFGNQDAPGYAADSEFGSEAVWGSEYIAVYHLEESAPGRSNPGIYTDATSNDYDADDEVNSTGKTGKIGLGQEIRARESTDDDYILFPSDVINGENQFTASFWLNTSQTGDQALLNAGADNNYLVFLRNTQLTLYDGSGTVNFVLDTAVIGAGWKHFVVIRDATNNQWRLYIDGVPDNQNPLSETMSALSVPQDCFLMGLEQDNSCLNSTAANQHLDGFVDELRFQNTVPTPGEVSAMFRNQATTTDFYSIGTIDTLTVPNFNELDHWVQHFDNATEEADIWVQIDSIPAGASTTIYLYYGNTGATSASDEYAPFTYSTTTDLYYVVNGNESGAITIYSLIDDNEIVVDGISLGILQSGESTTTSSYTAASVVSTRGPITSRSGADSGEALVPISFATTTHVIASNRGNENFYVHAPFATANVDIYDGNAGTPEDGGMVTVDTTTVFSVVDIASGNAGIIESDEPILVYMNNTNDGIVAYPPTTRDLYGIRSNDFFFSSAGSNYDVGIYCSAGGVSTSTGLARGAQTGNLTCTGASGGGGAAVRLANQTAPITAIQQRDGDGTESSIFLPTPEFGTRYILPQDTEYIAVACAPRFGPVTIEVQTAGGATISGGTCTPSGNNPGALNLTAGGVFSQGYQVVATNNIPFYMYYEQDGNNDETNTWSAVQARKFSPTPLNTVFGAQEITIDAQYEQLSYHWFENLDDQTPINGWQLDEIGTETTEAVPITDAGAINVGDVLRVRMNLRANVATGTVASTAFKLQYAEAETCSIATGWSDIGEIGSSTASFSGFGNDSVSDGGVLSNTLLTQSTVAGTYEEENFTSFIQTEIGVGETAEWDWVIEATNPAVNTLYCFRMVRASGEELVTYTTYPQLETAGPPFAPTLLNYFDNQHTPEDTPILEFAAVDSSNDEIDYQVQIDDDINFDSVELDRNSETHFSEFENLNTPSDKQPFASGARVRFSAQSSLSDGTTYWWRVRGRDPDGSDAWGDWSVPSSFTTNSSVVLSEWFQTTGNQFSTNQLSSLSTSSGAVAVVGSAGTMRSTAIEFNDGTDTENAWGEFSWNDTETSGTILYQVEYFNGSSWSLIPNSALSGNSTGFGTSPINLLGLNTDEYGTIRLVANFSGTNLSIQDWTIRWGERVGTPELSVPFDHEKLSTTTPTFSFVSTDPEGDYLEYELSYGTDFTFVSSTTVNAGTSTSGSIINYTLGGSLSNGTTYWWRVRAKDPDGSDTWSPWAEPHAFTTDTSVTLSTWFQTTEEQFETGTLEGTEASPADEVEVSTRIGEYGTIVLNDGVWTGINTNKSYNSMVVVGSPEYESDADNARTVRVRNKSADSFEILVDNFDSSLSGTTSVDYIVMESGTWEIPDGSGTIQVIAGTAEDVTEVKSRPYSNTAGTYVDFVPDFSSPPAVLATVSSDNDSTWVGTHVDDGNSRTAEVTANDMYISLARSFETAVHDPEDVDYIVFEPADGTNDGASFKAFNSPNSVNCCNSGTAVNYPTAFSTAPAVTVVHNNAENGGDGGFAVKDLQTPSTASTVYLETPEMGTGANGHANEVVSVVAFEDASGFIVRESGVGTLTGTIRSEAINFTDGAGPKFEQVYWSDTEPGASSIIYQIEYESSPGVWALIPNTDLPGNSAGTSTAPIDLSNLNVSTYDTIRLVATLECSGGNCPTLQDWTLEWSEGVPMTGTLKAYDRITNVASGTIAVAVNGTLLGSTGSVSNGSWTVNNITAFAGDVITVFVDGAAEENEAVGVFVYDGIGNITGVELFEQHLSISADETGTTTNALLGSYDYSVSGDEDVFFNVDAQNDLTICAIGSCEKANLYVGSGNIYIPDTTGSGNVVTHDLINDGRIELDSNTVRVSGSWENNGTLLSETSTVIFTATTTNLVLGTWYDEDWNYRLPITIDADEVDATLTDFPVYVDLSTLPSSFFSAVRSDGADIRVTGSDEVSEVPFELVAIDTGAETGELHFKANSLSNSTDTTFYIYYGNSGASPYATTDPFGRNNVWTNGYAAVYHLEEGDSTAPGFYIDATGNGYDGTLVDGNGNSGVGSGQLGQAFDFNGDADYIDTFADATALGIGGASAKSISAWAFTESYNDGGPFSLGTRTTGEDYSLRTLTSVNNWRVQHWGTPDHDFSYTSQNQWVHFALDYNGAVTTLYADGVDTSNEAAALNTTNTFDFRIGSWHNTNFFNGRVDEVRVATTSRSAEWYAAEYSNQNTPGTFYLVGTETNLPLVPSPWTIDDASGLITFNNVTFGETSSIATWKTLDIVDINGSLAVNQGTYDRSSSTITVAQNVTIGANGALSGIATTTFDGASAAQWTDNTAQGENLGLVVIDGNTKTVIIQSDVLSDSITIGANDTLNAGGANTLNIEGNFTNTGTFLPQTSTLAIVGSATNAFITMGASQLNNLTASSTGGGVSFVEANVTLLGDLTIATGTVTGATAITRVGGSFQNTGGVFAHNNAEVRFTGSGNETVQLQGTEFFNHFYDVRFSGSGEWTFLDTNATTSNIFRITNGNVIFPSGQLSVARDFLTSGGGSFDANGGEVLFVARSTDSITTNGSALHDVRVRAGSPIRGGDFDAAWLYRNSITIQASQIDEDLTDFPIYLDLGDFDTSFFSNINADGGDIRITQSDGVSEVPLEIVAVDTGAETGELYFKAPTLSSTTNSTFYIYYGNAATSSYAIDDPYGAENVWDDDFLAVYHMEEVNAVDSTAFSKDTVAVGDTPTLDTGLFGAAVRITNNAGSDYLSLQDNLDELAGRPGMTVSAWVNVTENSVDDSIFTRGGAGTAELLWDNIGGTTHNDTWTFNVDNTSVAGNRVDAAPTGISVGDTWQHVVGAMAGTNRYIYVDGLLRNTNSGGATTIRTNTGGTFIGYWAGSTNFDYDGLIDEYRISRVERNAAWVAAEYANMSSPSSFYTLSLGAGEPTRIFSDAVVTATGDVVLESATTQFPSTNFLIAGSLDNDALFSAGSGAVTFNATTPGHTISVGSSTFSTLAFNGAGGGWTIDENATATNAINLIDGDSLVVDSGITLESTGTFTNDMANAATTWTGATLRLSSGNDFTINDKASEGDDYNILTVVGDSDIAMWNSTANTYDTQDTSSIYSQDHAGNDGDLYIFGDYIRTSGVEYWTYTTDFDGLDLTGGNERQVNVRVANGASITASSSTLLISGISTASTTVDAQSGSFTLISQGATVTAQYFEMTGTDANGFQLLSSSTVTSLDNAEFTIPTASAAVTVDSSTIDTSPGSQFFNTDFVTGGGNVNVTLSGSPTSFWWFRDGEGDRYGEAFDNADGDPGAIRWDDSNYQITISGTVYADDGSATLAGPTCDGVTNSVRIVVDGGAYTDAVPCNGLDGNYSFSDVEYGGDALMVVYLDTNGGTPGTVVTRTPTGDITDLDIYANRVITRHENTAPLTIADMTSYDNDDDSDILFTASTSTSPDTLDLLSGAGLYVWNNTEFVPNGTVTLLGGGNFMQDGSLTIGPGATYTSTANNDITIGGSLYLESGAVFDGASSTVTFTATNTAQQIGAAGSSTITFYNLEFTGAGGGWSIQTPIISTTNILVNDGTLSGVSGITVQTGAFTGEGSVDMTGGTVNVRRASVLGGSGEWAFYNLTLGNAVNPDITVRASNATTTVRNTLTIATGHFLDAYGSVWDLQGSGATFVENGTFIQGTSTVRYSGATPNITQTPYHNLVIDTESGLSTDATAPVTGLQVLGNLTVGVLGTSTLDINTNDPLLAVSGNVHIGTLGTIEASNSTALNVLGNWDNDGSFVANGGTVAFLKAGGSASVAAGNSDFANVVVSGTAGYTFTESATTTGAFTLAAGSFTLQNGESLTVGGVFTNAMNDGATTWTGTTLRLTSGTAYTINLKTTSDTYATIEVAAGTHPRLWNSSVATTTTEANSSLYSMDHDGVDGDLYIYGYYSPVGQTDYWNYDTDFDGASLSGGNERQVDVYFVGSSTRQVEIFTSDDTFVPPAGVTEVDVLVVAGGGGGGSAEGFSNAGGGGGGGGGLIYETAYSVTPLTPVALTVGAGGAAGSGGNVSGTNGENSTFGPLTALGGGGGAGGNVAGNAGGSGGGGRGATGGAATQPGSPDGGFGNDGATWPSATGDAAGGGGGAGAAAPTGPSTTGGDGGDGLVYSITGASTTYAGGGAGGGAQTSTPGTGGAGGGGNGANDSTAPTAGAANTGGGGGGGNNTRPGASGGSGIVIVSYDLSAGLNLTAGSLSILGSPIASTTIQSLGAGEYEFTLGGTVSSEWENVVVRDINANGLTFNNTAILNDFTSVDLLVESTDGTAMTVAGSVIDANPAKEFNFITFATTTPINAYNVTATGFSVSAWRFVNAFGNLVGEAKDVDPGGDPGYITWEDSAAIINISGTVYSDEGISTSAACDGATGNIRLSINGSTFATTTCDGNGLGGGTGEYTFTGISYGLGNTLTVYIDGEPEKATTLTQDPISSIANFDLYENRVIIKHESTAPMTISDMGTWDSDDDPDVLFDVDTVGNDTLTLPADTKLIVWNNKEFEPQGDVIIPGGGSGGGYDGTFELRPGAMFTGNNGEEYTIGGSLLSGAGAVFDSAQSTTTFTTTGAGRTIDTNDGGFHNVRFTGSGSWNVTDTQFNIDNDLNKVGGSLTLPTGTTTVGGSFTNSGGTFNANSGTLVFTATDVGNDVTFGGSNVHTLRFEGVGSWNISDVNATATDSFIVATGTVALPAGVFEVGNNFVVTDTITHNNGTIRLTGTGGGNVLTLSNNDLNGVLVVAGAGDYTQTDAGASLLGDLIIESGTYTAGTSTLSIGGSFDATGGTFVNSNGTVLFNSNDTGEIVDAGESEFYNVSFAGVGGGWTIVDNATSTNNLTISTGVSFTQAPGTTLYVGGVFTNTLGGSATNWSGSTLVLDSGTEYEINLKSTPAERYDTLLLGINTDISAWNTSATSTSVPANSSLYSQDHAGVDGDLYIYGDYHIATTTEYWSYATDFDGTVLGSPRAVNVTISDGSNVIVEGGALNIVGAVSATTSVASQGAGTYTFVVDSGTFNAQYYSFRNLTASGLQLTGDASITSLSYGDFEQAANGGALITLASTTLNANASLLITNTRFDTGGFATGLNVSLDATTTNSWNFTGARGDLWGEDFDLDGSDQCSSIRWDDSDCLLTEQTTYRWRNDDGGEGAPAGTWYDTDWDARKRIRVINHDPTAYTDVVVKLDVVYDANMQSDFDDLRFTDSTGTVLIDHWRERFTTASEADVWVRIPHMSTSSVTEIYMYYGNVSANSISNATNVFVAADDFEDNDISEYSGDTSLFATGGTYAYGGGFGLDASPNPSAKATDGIARTDITVSQGQIIRYMQYVNLPSGSGDEVCTMFAVQAPVTNNQNYAVCLSPLRNRVTINENVVSTDTTGTQLASSSISLSSGWYEVEIDWQTNDTIDVSVFNSAGALQATTSAVDSTYTSGGIGFTFWFQNGGWDSYVSWPRTDTKPTAVFGVEQERGGASWAAPQDTPTGGFLLGQTARLRVGIENTGLPITDQNFRLEFAPKLAAPTCSAVGGGNYTAVPPVASCGASEICMATSTNVTNGDTTTDHLLSDAGVFVPGRVVANTSNQSTNLDVSQNEFTELEYVIKLTANALNDAYCFRVTDAGATLDSYALLPELTLAFDPELDMVFINDGLDISLTSGTTTTVIASTTVTDYNGFNDLTHATTTFYKTSVGAACTPDNNNCYVVSGDACTFSNCSGTSCTLNCSADFLFHADATDSDGGEEWFAFMEVSDAAGGVDLRGSNGVEVLTLRALQVLNSISYGTVDVNENTGAFNPNVVLNNIGNESVDVQVSGTDMTDGIASVIPANRQRFSTTTFDYAACVSCNSLSITGTTIEVDLNKPTTTTPLVSDEIYWGIEVPFGTASNPHSGINTFTVVAD